MLGVVETKTAKALIIASAMTVALQARASPLQKWLHLMYLWSIGEKQLQAVDQSGISSRTMVDVYSFFRKVCTDYFSTNPVQLGGDGIICQIDESQFQSKPKYQRGRQLGQQAVWVFGIVDVSTTPAVVYMEIVDRRDANTLASYSAACLSHWQHNPQ